MLDNQKLIHFHVLLYCHRSFNIQHSYGSSLQKAESVEHIQSYVGMKTVKTAPGTCKSDYDRGYQWTKSLDQLPSPGTYGT